MSTRGLAVLLAALAASVSAGCDEDPNSLRGSGTLAPARRRSTGDVTTGTGGSRGNGTGNGTGNGDDAPPPVVDAVSGSACVDTINAYRARVGAAPLARWTDAESCTTSAARSDSGSGEAHGAFGTCGELAQNECPGWAGPADRMIGGCLKLMWDEGPGGGHYENMKNGRYTRVACGFYTLPNGDVWAVQNFE